MSGTTIYGIRYYISRNAKQGTAYFERKISYSKFSNTSTENSDIDLLISFNAPIGIEFIDLADELENITGKKIDLVCKEALKPRQLAYLENQLLYVE